MKHLFAFAIVGILLLPGVCRIDGEPLSLEEWLEAAGVPAGLREPTDRHGTLHITNLLAYAMGIPPQAVTMADLPRLEPVPGEAGLVQFVYQVHTKAVEVHTRLEASTDLENWLTAEPVELNTRWDENGMKGFAAVFEAASDLSTFYRMQLQWVPQSKVAPPSVPAGVTPTHIRGDSIGLSWHASTHDAGVAGYHVRIDGADPVVAPMNRAAITGLQPGTHYSFTVSAFDADGSESAESTALALTTMVTPIVPYSLPTIETEAAFSNVVYIDPSGPNGNGSIETPYNTLIGLTIQPDTAYLIKRGTILDERPLFITWKNIYIGAYGVGAIPILNRGLVIWEGSADSTFADLHIRATGGNDIIRFRTQSPQPTHITIAYCRIEGVDGGEGYPWFGIQHSANHLVFFNNEISHSQNNGWWLTSSESVRIIRNWFHHQNMGGVDSITSTGDTIQAIYDLNNAYLAGNHLDKSHAMWKYTLMFNIPLGSTTTANIVAEYNTFVTPQPGAGGAGVRWVAGRDSTFRKNVVNGLNGITPFDTWPDNANQPAPYGIRDNHVLTAGTVSTNGVVLDPSNTIFGSIEAYQTYLDQNPGLYGSDIDTDDFWSE